MNYITKDSGKREEFDSGSRRDTQEGKPRPDLIPPKALRRVAELYARGAEKYGEHNWAKGQPTSRYLASLCRHLEQFRDGETDEDHLAAVVFNAFGIMHFQGTEWDDTYDWNKHLISSQQSDEGFTSPEGFKEVLRYHNDQMEQAGLLRHTLPPLPLGADVIGDPRTY